MNNTKFDFVGNLKKYLIISAAFVLIGVIIACVFGVKLHINYTGGSRFTYTYTGEIDNEACEKLIAEATELNTNVTSSKSLVGDDTKLVITMNQGDVDISKMQTSITELLEKNYPDNAVKFGEANTVSATVAGRFFVKSIIALVIAAVLVIIYLGFRFRKIGGVSAGIVSFACLLHDCIMAFFTCVIFRLEIDANFIAVALTILGYSINATIVIYDRIRENYDLNPATPYRETVNLSINQTLRRSLVTSIATIIAGIAIIVAAELFGITSLRTFAIPMTVGLIFGCYSSVCLAGPIWTVWQERKAQK